jgi:hypothetical protein
MRIAVALAEMRLHCHRIVEGEKEQNKEAITASRQEIDLSLRMHGEKLQ